MFIRTEPKVTVLVLSTAAPTDAHAMSVIVAAVNGSDMVSAFEFDVPLFGMDINSVTNLPTLVYLKTPPVGLTENPVNVGLHVVLAPPTSPAVVESLALVIPPSASFEPAIAAAAAIFELSMLPL